MWVRVLKLIVQMNKEGLLVDKINPFDFENHQLKVKLEKTEIPIAIQEAEHQKNVEQYIKKEKTPIEKTPLITIAGI